MKEYFTDLLPWVRDLAVGLIPGALGAVVSVAVQATLTWTQRFIQLTVGIIVSYYAGEAVAHLYDVSDVVKNSVGFVAGIGAFEVVKALRKSLGEVAQEAPKDIWSLIKARFGGKGK